MQTTGGQKKNIQSGDDKQDIIETYCINPEVGDTEYDCVTATLYMYPFNGMTGRKQTEKARFFGNKSSMHRLGRLVKKDNEKHTFENGEVIKIVRNRHGRGIICFNEVKKQNEQIPSFKLNDKNPYMVLLECNQLKQDEDADVYVIFSQYDANPLYSQHNTKLIHPIEDYMLL